MKLTDKVIYYIKKKVFINFINLFLEKFIIKQIKYIYIYSKNNNLFLIFHLNQIYILNFI